ncbi:MAG: GNAT family N-acetyltransferase [Candidatus Limnocylindria bacterium]
MVSGGRLLHVNVSRGGVPKRQVDVARITATGVEGDRQSAVTVHGGPHRAVSILGIEAIQRVAAEGHPIAPGTTGENLTTEGFDVSTLPPGTRLAIGEEVELELAAPAGPCETIRESFIGGRFARLNGDRHPTDSRMYARVITEGEVRPGDPIVIRPPVDDGAERHLVLDRLDAAERKSSVAMWRAAATAGQDVQVLDDGEIAVATAPGLPGPIFNSGLGFANLPNLVDLALTRFRSRVVTGWVVADAPPWEGATLDATYARYAAPPVEVGGVAAEGISVREMESADAGIFSRVIIEASQMTGALAHAFVELEPSMARDSHLHRFVAEIDGRAVGVATLRTHHHVGWLRSASVLPEFRGRGAQRALIVARARLAAELGCELVGSSALEGSVSARNIEASGLRRLGTRRGYRYEPPTA